MGVVWSMRTSLRLLATCLAALAPIVCATAQTDKRPPTSSATAASPAKRTPEIGTFGFNVNGMDRSVAPGDDFVRYAVGKWVDSTEIPADRSSIGSVAVIKGATMVFTPSRLCGAGTSTGSGATLSAPRFLNPGVSSTKSATLWIVRSGR